MKPGLRLAQAASKFRFDPVMAVDRLKFMLTGSGWPGLAGLLLLLAAAGAEFVAVPQERDIAAGNQQAAERARQEYMRATAGDAKGQGGGAETLARFRERLTPDGQADGVFETIQRDAQKYGLAPTGTEYKWQRQAADGLSEVRIDMPLKAGYAPLRAFVKDVLTDVPGLALEEFDLKRENIGANVVDARLRFALYLKVGT
jgi:hypothetical protein